MINPSIVFTTGKHPSTREITQLVDAPVRFHYSYLLFSLAEINGRGINVYIKAIFKALFCTEVNVIYRPGCEDFDIARVTLLALQYTFIGLN